MNSTTTLRCRSVIFAACGCVLWVERGVEGQSLSDQLAPQTASITLGSPTRTAVQRTSLISITPPAPRVYQKHDLVEVIINKTSVQSFEQSLDTEKKYDIMAALTQFPSIAHLLEAQLVGGDNNNPARLNITSDSKFEGDGEYERKDKVQSRITATILDVKPNGTIVLEARESIRTDKEVSTMVLSGICRQEDITRNNTIESSQLADFMLDIQHEGQVKKAGEKGLIPRVLETIFNF